jgi:hypothetical protein
MAKDCGNHGLMPEFGDRFARRDRRLRQAAAWAGAAGIYGAAQRLSPGQPSAYKAAGTRPQYEQSNARHSRRLARRSRSSGQR